VWGVFGEDKPASSLPVQPGSVPGLQSLQNSDFTLDGPLDSAVAPPDDGIFRNIYLAPPSHLKGAPCDL
jgi:hypothetical protein